ncbi:type VII secretion protein EccB [Catenuloplanes sp. NPDC051500]|uniref:type VII secretion protein EccB n=1 Tax=Catenuloplanes sp. NPDC051500 TaxID=3363959 RepID=UPI0037BAD57B
MPSRRDQLFSNQFMMQRVVSAFAFRDADAARVPFPRAAGTLFIGAMAAVLALAAVGIFGVLFPSGKKTWRSDEVLILEKDTGARYVYLDGKLHPVLNYTSARLILKSAAPSVVSVSRASLRGTPRGAPLGIAGVPDSLPEPERLRPEPWSLCSRPVTTDTGSPGTDAVLYIADLPGAAGRQLGDDALLAGHPDGSFYLVWHDLRFLLREPQMVFSALALTPAQVIPAAPAFVNAIPQGADIGPIPIAERGAPAGLSGALVGQVVRTRSQSGDSQFYVVLADGIADITELQADLIINDPATAAAYPGGAVEPLTRNDLGGARRSARGLPAVEGQELVPARRPRVVEDGARSVLCTTFGGVESPMRLTIGATLPGPGAGVSAAQPGGAAAPDEVVVPAGDGVLAEAVSGPDAPAGTFALVTDQGVRYSLASPEALRALGYDTGRAVRMPAALVAMLREGPALDPVLARVPA